MGRRTKLTSQLQDDVCKTLTAGVSLEIAAAREGIGKTTLYEWLKKGKVGEEPYAAFYDATERAMANVETHVTASILKASRHSWQAGAWWIKWKNTRGAQRIELTGADGQPLGSAQLSAEAADAIRQKILFGDKAPKQLPADEPEPVDAEVDE